MTPCSSLPLPLLLTIALLFGANALQAMLPQHQLAVSLWAFGALIAVLVIPTLINILESLMARVLRLEHIDNAKVKAEHEAVQTAVQAAKAARKAAEQRVVEAAQEDFVRGLVASLLAARAVGVAPAPIAVAVPAPNAVPAVHPR